MKQQVLMPSYWSKFSCIASKCEETCCAGWYIAIDEVTYKKYKKVKHPEMKKRLDKELVLRKGAVSKECIAKIKLKNNRCAFLGKDDLCDIYRNLGESYLSETCKVYPRNVNLVGECKELSIALSCPEAARVVLLQKEPITFTIQEDTEHLPIVGGSLNISSKAYKHFEDALLPMRNMLMGILQNREISFVERMRQLGQAFSSLDLFKKKQDMKGLIAFLEGHNKMPKVKEKSLYIEATEEEMKAYWQVLIKMHDKKKWPSATHEACYSQMVRGLSKHPEEAVWSSEKYEEAIKYFYEVVLDKWAYIFENYFVSYIYERLVPLDQATVKESFEALQLYFKLFMLYIIGIYLDKGSIDETDILLCIQSFTRVFDHNELCKEQFKKLIAD